MSLTSEVKDYALDLGYHAVGITTAEPFAEYARALAERADDYSWAIEHGLRLGRAIDPQDRLPGAKAIIVAVYDYFQEGFPPELVGKIGRMYQARCYLAPPQRLGGARVQLMRQFLEGKGMQVGRYYGPSSGVPDRLAAGRAGLAQFGRNTFAAAPNLGTFVSIHTYIVDAELEPDEPLIGMHCPPQCRVCIDACPTGAIVADFRMNPRRCIAFNHFAAVEGVKNASPYIDPELRPKMGEWIHGCDICQQVCPRNQAKLKAKLPVNPFLARAAQKFSLLGLLNRDEACYSEVIPAMMYNYLRDAKYFQRNAAIALANQGDRAVVPDLARAMDDPEELVRAHVAWALGRLGGAEARAALESALSREVGEQARSEIVAALEVA